MKIGLIADNSKNFPSLPLMKISAYHKSKGDTVELATVNSNYDLCYVSKTFNINLKTIPDINIENIKADKFLFGGSGYAIDIENQKEIYHIEKDKPLCNEIEHIYPDYTLYPECKNISYGFLSRGCPNNCNFCIITKKEGKTSYKFADLKEWHNGQKYIKLLDPNVLACKDRDNILQQLIDSKAYIDFTQGLDARLIDDDAAKMICQTRVHMVHFAFDLIKNEQKICKGLEIFKKHFKKSDRYCKVYILTNYNTTFEEDYYRIKKVIELGYRPDIRIYQKNTAPQITKDLARWTNNDYVYRTCSNFEDYQPRKNQIVKQIYEKEINSFKRSFKLNE